ncbi:MAG: OmpA family protein [Alloprevotella sp.]|nr:OmpA family protein [Alloprevotella sp.]
MRKIVMLFAVAAMTVTASAQSFEGTKFFDNWTFGVEGGATTKLGSDKVVDTNKGFNNTKFFKGLGWIAGAELTKYITPTFGIAVQDHVAFNWTDSKTVADYNDLVLLGKVNLVNLFAGYKGTPRVFELEAVAGVGWRYYFNSGINYIDVQGNRGVREVLPELGDHEGLDDVIAKAGLNLLFNLGQKKAWTFAIKPAVIFDVDGFVNPNASGLTLNKNHAQFELTAGFTYHFKNSNGKNYFTNVRPYDQAEVDGLNAKINDLRGNLADKDAQLDAAKRRIADLENELNDCRNQKPIVKEVAVEKQEKLMESAITFRQGKSVIDPSQAPNVERVATYLKNHPEAKVIIRGYASPEGSLELNTKLAEARAQIVKSTLVKKYKIAADRIDATGQGIGNMFSEPEWNRVSICTLDVK